MQVVLSPNNCSLTKYTHPTQDYLQSTAESLKAQLIVLAHQLVGN
jgi:hypothetical protein